VDVAVETFIGEFVDGTVTGGENEVYDLEVDGVGLATTGGFIDDIQSDIDGYRQQIIDGTITVPTTP
jgi:basic membrane protein A